MKSLCVFCGSNLGARDSYAEAARGLGRLLAERGVTLVYGGAAIGLMGAVADAALEAGGRVVGVMPRGFLSGRSPIPASASCARWNPCTSARR